MNSGAHLIRQHFIYETMNVEHVVGNMLLKGLKVRRVPIGRCSDLSNGYIR